MSGVVRAITCPQCGAGLTPPSRFARTMACSFCHSTVQLDPSIVSVAKFREALEHWNAPASHGFADWITVRDAHFAGLQPVARGDHSDVFVADRARVPRERVYIKILRDPRNKAHFAHQATVLEHVARFDDPAAGHFRSFLPNLVRHGAVEDGPHKGRQAIVYRYAPGFVHTLGDVARAHPGGIDPKIAVWLWRRTLEVLTFVHRNGVTHGDLQPAHVLPHRREHAVRLVGFGPSDAGRSPRDDIRMSALAIRSVLPTKVPEPFAELLNGTATGTIRHEDAWTLRETIARTAQEAFGQPSYNPLPMPDSSGTEIRD